MCTGAHTHTHTPGIHPFIIQKAGIQICRLGCILSLCHNGWAATVTMFSQQQPVASRDHDVHRAPFFVWRQRQFSVLSLPQPAEVTQIGLKSPKMVQFGRFKRLNPLNEGCPIAWSGYLVHRTEGKWFLALLLWEFDGYHGNRSRKVLLRMIPYHLGEVLARLEPKPWRR